MKILLLGGTSYFGIEIAKELRDVGHEVTLFTRGHRRQEGPSPFPHIQGDRAKEADLKRAAAAGSWDVLVDNIAYNGADVTKALQAFPHLKRYVLTSSISVYRFSADGGHNQPLTEEMVDYDLKPEDENPDDMHWKYARGKLEAEKALVRQTKVPWVITRPTLVYGPHDVTERGYWYLARLLKGGPMILPNGGLNALRLVFSRDLAHLHVPLVTKESATGRIFNVAQKEIVTLREFLEVSAQALGAKQEFVSIPFETAGELGGPFAYNRSWIPDISRAGSVLGYRPTPWLDFASMTATWFRDSWSGDMQKLLESRPKELELARRWAQLSRGKVA